MNTFFFGYLPLKWKRLARVLSFILSIVIPYSKAESGYNRDFEYNFAFTLLIFIITVAIISYTLKPFIVKD